MKSTVLAVLFLSSSIALPQDYPSQQLLGGVTPEAIRAHMNFLADDLLEGRGTGTRGQQLAANYIRANFEALGLKPAGSDGGYFQMVPFRRIELDREQSSVTIERGEKRQTLAIDRDFAMRGDPLQTDTTATAAVVFVGYGVTAPEYHYDDYAGAGADVKGKIVAVLYGAPPSFPSAPGARYSDNNLKVANAVAHGAVGILSIWAGRLADRVPFSFMARNLRMPAMRWLDPAGLPNDAYSQIHGAAILSAESASSMFDGAQKSLKDALADAAQSHPQAFPLPVTASIHVVSHHTRVESPNVIAVLPGSDAQLKNEYVVLTAHSDHLGIGEPMDGDNIYNGAVDDGSGTAALLAIAQAFSGQHAAPRRSILFLSVTAEEKGLLGSDYYAHYPTVPIASIVADVNMDGVAIFYDFKDIVPLGAEHSSLGKVVDDVARHFSVQVSPDPAPEEVYFIRSDQYSLVKLGVPSVAVSEGYQTADPTKDGKKISDDWEAHYYHTPQDDMKQPLDFDAAVKCTKIDMAIAYEVAQQTARPHWNDGDFFASFAKSAGRPAMSH
jgi:hypothetical protein